MNSEPLYVYLRTSISPRVFIEWPFFSGEIVAYQELFYVLALPVSSAQSAAHFLAGFSAVIARVALSNLTEMAMRSLLQSLLRSFVNGDRRDFDFVGIPYRGSIGYKGLDLYYKLMILLFSFCHSGVKLSNKLFFVQCTCRDKNEGCWYPSS